MLPQLADFDIPSNRQPEQLWTGDLKLLNAILAGEKPNAFIEVAVDTKQPQPLGLAMISLGEELLIASLAPISKPWSMPSARPRHRSQTRSASNACALAACAL